MEKPCPGEEHQRLTALVGQWRGEELWNPSPIHPKGSKTIGKVSAHMALDGFALIQDYQHIKDNEVIFRGHSIVRWDKELALYFLYHFDSHGGEAHIYKGQFENGVLNLVGKGASGLARTVLEPGANCYHYRYDVTPDGEQWFPLMSCRYVPVKE